MRMKNTGRQRQEKGKTDRRQMEVQSKKNGSFYVGGYTANFRGKEAGTQFKHTVDIEVFGHNA